MFIESLTAFLLACHVGPLLACWGGGGQKRNKTGMLNPDNPSHWGGWNPPEGAQNAWDTWLDNYNKQKKGKGGTHDPELHGEHPYGHNVKGWPADWVGLGPPLTGMAPPPWAYVPKNMGKPSFCYDPPVAGNCKKSLTRYGYNGFMDKCQPFKYTGCGGNRNNFVQLKDCEKTCMAIPSSGCDSDSKIPINTWIWSRRCGYSDDDPSDYLDPQVDGCKNWCMAMESNYKMMPISKEYYIRV